MAATYELIANNTLSSAAASVTFSAIPGTYTDLVLRASIRGTRASFAFALLYAEFNGDTATNYSRIQLSGNGSAAASYINSSQTKTGIGEITASTATANTFNSIEIYIPSYTVSQNKPIGTFNAQENNNTTAYIAATAGLWRNTNAITSIKLTPSSDSFDIGSSFFLYGIKNS